MSTEQKKKRGAKTDNARQESTMSRATVAHVDVVDMPLDESVAVNGGSGTGQRVVTIHHDAAPASLRGVQAEASRAVGDLMSSQDHIRRLKAQRVLSQRQGFNVVQDIAKRGVRFADYGLAPLDPFAALDAPSASVELMASQVRTALSLLAKKSPGTVGTKVVNLDGDSHLLTLLAHLDYDRMFRSVNLPIGDLGGIPTSQRDKLTAYMRLILQRIGAMSTIPIRDVDKVLASVGLVSASSDSAVKEFFSSYGIAFDIHSYQADPRGTIEAALQLLEKADQNAKERFVSQTILQPLYRNVFVNQSEFRGLSVDQIVQMGIRHAQWKRMVDRGAMASVIQFEVTRTITEDTFVSGLSSLRDATLLGVKQSAVFALSSLGEVVDGMPQCHFDTSNASHGLMAFGTPFLTVNREAVLHDMKGDPVVLRDRVTSEAFSNTFTSRDISALVLALAFYSGVDLSSQIDIEFMTRYPEWAGLVADPEVVAAIEAGEIDILHPWITSRLPFDFMVAVLNGDYADSPVLAAFAAQNGSDLQKIFDTGVQYYALAQHVIVRLIRELLGTLKRSFEWRRSAIWAELDKLGLNVQDVGTQAFTTKYVATTVSAAPLIHRNAESVSAVSYYLDRDAVAFMPSMARIYSTLETLGALGDLKVTALHERTLTISSVLPVDVFNIFDNDALPEHVRRELIGECRMIKADELNGLAVTSNADLNVTLFGANFSGEGALLAGFGYVSGVTPRILVELEGLDRLTQIPKKIVAGPNGEILSTEDEALLPASIRNQYVPVDPTFAFDLETNSTPVSVAINQVVIPQTLDDVALHVKRWAHDASRLVNDVSQE